MYHFEKIFLFALTVSARFAYPKGNLQLRWQNGTDSQGQSPMNGTGVVVTSSPTSTPASGLPPAPPSTTSRKARCRLSRSTTSTSQAPPATSTPQAIGTTTPPATSSPEAPPATSAPQVPVTTSAPKAAPASSNAAAAPNGSPPANTTTGSAPPQFFSVVLPTLASSLRTYVPQSAPTGASGCPPMMKGVTFNGGMNPGMFDTIGSAEDWITFQPSIPNGPASPKAAAAFVPMMAFASDVQAAIDMVNGPSPPSWMLTFNEPDLAYTSGGSPGTPTMSPQEAADAMVSLIAKPGKGTKYVAPVTADPTSDWLDQFYTACNCKDFFSAYNIHQYHPDSATVTDAITAFHQKYSDKPIWVTEVAPGSASPACSLSWDQVGTFMNDIYRFSAKSGFVDRVFWNTGNQIGPGDTNVCNSYLTDHTGGASPLLAAYKQVDCS